MNTSFVGETWSRDKKKRKEESKEPEERVENKRKLDEPEPRHHPFALSHTAILRLVLAIVDDRHNFSFLVKQAGVYQAPTKGSPIGGLCK